jgi:hypothetical protein
VHNSVLEHFSLFELNKRVEGFNQELAKFSMDKLFNHMSTFKSLTETFRKTITTLYQSGTTADIISTNDDMIVVDNMVDALIK